MWRDLTEGTESAPQVLLSLLDLSTSAQDDVPVTSTIQCNKVLAVLLLLNFITVDDASDVNIRHLGTRQVVTILGWGATLEGAVDLVQLLGCTLSEDDKATEASGGRGNPHQHSPHQEGCRRLAQNHHPH